MGYCANFGDCQQERHLLITVLSRQFSGFIKLLQSVIRHAVDRHAVCEPDGEIGGSAKIANFLCGGDCLEQRAARFADVAIQSGNQAQFAARAVLPLHIADRGGCIQ